MEWLNKIFDWLLQFVPQFEILSPSEEAVRITCIPFIYKWCKVKRFGWYMYWPLFQKFDRVIVKPQLITVELSREHEGKPIEAVWVVQFWIQNVYKALYESEDIEEMLVSQSAKVIGEHIVKGTTDQTEVIVKEITEGMSKAVPRGHGLYIQQVFPSQMVGASAHKLYLENLAEKVGRIVG